MTEPKRILYRGVPMIEGWPEKIMAAQEITHIRSEGREISRVRYGKEKGDWNAAKVSCHDCAVNESEFHVPGCDVEECPLCGEQIISCDCLYDEESE